LFLDCNGCDDCDDKGKEEDVAVTVAVAALTEIGI
jgi:hypothetical protein